MWMEEADVVMCTDCIAMVYAERLMGHVDGESFRGNVHRLYRDGVCRKVDRACGWRKLTW